MTSRRGSGDPALRRLAARVAKRLRAARETIVTAESCTGGYLAKCLTDLPGSSDYFERGWVVYANEAKQDELGVSSRQLARHGAVSEAVALALVSGALERTAAQHAVAVTGVAGPSGGRADKPVGTVWIGWGYRSRGRIRVHASSFRFRGNRDAVRRQAVAEALKGLLVP
jgi:nicotinamide-nucleotide amidase